MQKIIVKGFTLIELMIAVIIFSVIAVVSYRMITSLVITNEVAGNAQAKWGDLSFIMSNFSNMNERVIPLVGRDQDGNILPAVYGKPRLSGMYDSQFEATLSGVVGDPVFGNTPPKRIGYRYFRGSLYLVSWPFLNRVLTTRPEIELLIENVNNFQAEYLYPDNQWRDSWPPDGGDPTSFPRAIRVLLSLKSGESIERSWILR